MIKSQDTSSAHESTGSISDVISQTMERLRKNIESTPPQEKERWAKDAREYAERQAAFQKQESLCASKAPGRQLNNKLIDRSGQWGAAEKKITAMLGTGCLVALVGNRGCGKTQLGVEAIRTLASRGKRARYCTATEFFIEIKSTYNGEGRTEKDILDQFSRPLLLVIDEIGQRSESEWENRLLFELLNRRYNALKDTILISNQSAEEFQKSMGPSLVSRMIETGGLIECNWESYRK